MTSSDRAFAAFDSWAAHWQDHYGAGGAMGERIGRFAGALGATVAPGGAILDFGCGTGDISVALARQGWAVTACDGSTEMLERARHHDGIDWHHVPFDGGGALPFGDAAFDAVMASSVLEYVHDLDTLLAEFARVLRPGGWLLATVPDPRHPVRVREARKLPLARSRLLSPLVARTRWANDFLYLRLSVNRFGVDIWGRHLRRAGFEPHLPGAADHPLALIGARKPDGEGKAP